MGPTCGFDFLVPLKGGIDSIVHPPIGWEPETTIDFWSRSIWEFSVGPSPVGPPRLSESATSSSRWGKVAEHVRRGKGWRVASYRSIEGSKKRFLKSDSLQPFGKDWKILVLLWGVMIGFGGGCIRSFGAKYCGCALHSWVCDDLTFFN